MNLHGMANNKLNASCFLNFVYVIPTQALFLVTDNRNMNIGSLQKQQGIKPHRPGRTITCYYCGLVLREQHLQVRYVKLGPGNDTCVCVFFVNSEKCTRIYLNMFTHGCKACKMKK